VKDLLNSAIAINSSAFEDIDPGSGAPVFIGSKTESALLGFAKELSWPNYKDTRDSAEIVQTIPFLADRKSMGCVVRLLERKPSFIREGCERDIGTELHASRGSG
jgi:Ca2+-transporting ATPase